MIYFDYNSTTPVDSRVVEKMNPFFSDHFANASSEHSLGNYAKKAVDQSRSELASLLEAKPDEIIFCSGATEANNIAIQGLASKQSKEKNHIITSKIEHPSVLEPLKKLELNGYSITYLDVDRQGVVDVDSLENSITPNTFLVSIMSANNETGTVQPLEAIGKLTKKHNIIFHTDAAQAVGHIPIDVDKMNIDLLSLSGHKFYGPKGIGALFIRNRVPRVRLNPLFFGGEQEKNLRSGTLNVPGIVGLGEASRLIQSELKNNAINHFKLTNEFIEGMLKIREDIIINGSRERRLPHTFNVSIPNIDNKWLILKLKDYCFSTGSACASGKDEPSHVLLSMGLNEDLIRNSIRLSVGNKTTSNDIALFLKDISLLI